MEFKYLNTFMAVVQEGSFSKAAGMLGYTQSAITFQMRQLEQELSMKLFEKVGRQMVLSPAGEKLIPYAKEVLLSVEKMKSLNTSLSQLEGTLTLAMAETQLCYRLPRVLKKFREKAPKAKLILRSMNCYEARDALISGSIDLGVFYEDVGGTQDSLTCYEIEDCPLTLVASPSTKKAFPDFLTPGRHLEVPFLIDEPNCIFRQIFEEYLKERKITLGHTIELWSIPTIKHLVENDMGISYLPAFTVEQELMDGRLCGIDTDLRDRTITAVCAHHKNKWVSPLMKLFIELCLKSRLG
ncbi:LysR family transcriptional regulator [bacterium 210820-DFI.6.37]|nr:LysR family transcriptional regulator [bacterium 210820-DFI.6.37]